MIRDITLGQFYNTDSVIHRLDPRAKLFLTFMYLISLFLTKNTYFLVTMTIVFLLYMVLSRVPAAFILKGLRPVWVLITITAILNLFYREGETVFRIWRLSVTDYGLRNAALVFVRMILMIGFSSLLTYTTRPTAIMDGLESSLRFLERLQVPVHDIAMMMSIALRFIPVLLVETDRIMKAQTARGAEFGKGSPVTRLKAYVPIIIPLFVAAARRSTELAGAMEARCYRGGAGRTKFRPLQRHWYDFVVYLIGWAIFLGGLLLP